MSKQPESKPVARELKDLSDMELKAIAYDNAQQFMGVKEIYDQKLAAFQTMNKQIAHELARRTKKG